jgi:hypothetical protein
MRGSIRRAVVVVSAAVVVLGPAAGVASASAAPVLGWAPTTSPGTYSYGTLHAGQAASQVFTLTNSGNKATGALSVTLTGSAAFTKTKDTCSGVKLGTNGSCSVTVSYAPAASNQNDSAKLTATSSKPAATASLALTGASTKASPVIATSASPGGPVGSTTVTDTATLSGGSSPTGTMEFKLYGPSAAANCSGTPVDDETVSVSGNGSYTTPAGAKPAQAGTYWWTASYSGDSHNTQAATACGAELVSISKASPAIATAPSAGGTIGSAVTDSAALAGGDNPTGTIEFKLYGPSAAADCSGTPVDDETVTVSGDGGYTTPAGAKPAQVGTYWWTASYSGDTSNGPAASGCGAESVTIGKASPAIATSPSAGATAGSAMTDTAALAGGDNPTGTIEFKLYGPSAAANCSGTPTFDQTVSVSGDGSYTSPPFTPTQAGTYWWAASYSGDAGNDPAASGCDQESVTVSKASPAIATSPAVSGTGAVGGTTVTDTATLAGGSSPGGTIEFKLYGPSTAADCSGTPVDDETVTVSGNGDYTTPAGATPAQAGTYWWTASYSGDTSNGPALSGCGAESVTMSKAPTVFLTAPSPGGTAGSTTVTDTVTLLGGSSPTGTIEFKLYGPSATANCSGTPVDAETVSVRGNGDYTTPAGFTPGQAGTYYWTVSYSGDDNNTPDFLGCGAQSVTIAKASPAIATTPSPGGPAGNTVTDTATLSGGSSPGGTIEFKLYGPSVTANCSGTPADDETVSVRGNGGYVTPAGFTSAQAGTYYWTASYSGDTNNTPADSGCGESVTIGKASPGIATAPSQGGIVGTAITDTAALAGGSSPDGTIEFTLYGPSATANCSTSPVFDQTVSVSGDGSYTSPSFTPTQAGTYWWVASYSGDDNNNQAATGCGDESVTIS